MKYFLALAVMALLFLQVYTQTTCSKGSDESCVDQYGSGTCCAYVKGDGLDGYYCYDRAYAEAYEPKSGEEVYCANAQLVAASMAVTALVAMAF